MSFLPSCSFCGKDQKAVRKLIAGPGVYICDGCIYLCLDVLGESGIHDSPWGESPPRVTRVIREASLEIKVEPTET